MKHMASIPATRRGVRVTRRRAAVTVETAFALPVLFLVVFGLMGIAYAFMVQHLMQDAARQGCRVAVCPSSTNTKVTDTVNALLQAGGISKATTTILVNDVPADVCTATANNNICVQITIAASDVALLPGLSYLHGELKGSCTLRVE